MTKQHIIVTGGGTGGHFFPAKAVIEAAQNSGMLCTYIGCLDGRESDWVSQLSCEVRLVPGLKRNSWRQKLCLPYNAFSAWRQIHQYFKTHPPTALVATGGYVSLIPCRVALERKVPLYLLEQNCIPGKVVRHFSTHAERVGLTFDLVSSHVIPKAELVGNPMGRERCVQAKSRGHRDVPQRLLVMGGSQSADALDTLVADLAEKGALDGMSVVHIAMAQNHDRLRGAYTKAGISHELMTFCHDMGSLLRDVDVAICRAGASTATELALYGIPAIFVPYPYAADDHQAANADFFVRHKAGVSYRQGADLYDNVAQALTVWRESPEQFVASRNNMLALAKPEAAQTVVNWIRDAH